MTYKVTFNDQKKNRLLRSRPESKAAHVGEVVTGNYAPGPRMSGVPVQRRDEAYFSLVSI